VNDPLIPEPPLDGGQEMMGANADEKMSFEGPMHAVAHGMQPQIAFEGRETPLHRR
jgi:hypothetical protein